MYTNERHLKCNFKNIFEKKFFRFEFIGTKQLI